VRRAGRMLARSCRSGAAIVLYGVFVVVERTVPAPLMRLNLLARRPIAAGAF
jgi:hypothetical protein